MFAFFAKSYWLQIKLIKALKKKGIDLVQGLRQLI